MKAWLKRTLGLRDEPQINTDLNAVDDYVVVKKKDLDALVGELADLRSMNLSTDARELDLLLGNMEMENAALKKQLKKPGVQVSPQEFVAQIKDKEDIQGMPTIWAEWPTMNCRE
jgi:hypothetical protein